MDQIAKQVAAVRRRLVIEQFLNRAVGCLLVTMIVAAVAIAAPRIIVLANIPKDWDAWWLLGGLGVGLAAATIWTAYRSRSDLDAAIEIDQRFKLSERVASSLSLSQHDQQTPAGKAVVTDAMRAIGRIDVGQKFRVQLSRRAWWPLVPAAISFCLMTFIGNREASSNTQPIDTKTSAAQVKKSVESLRKKIAQRKKDLAAKGLKDAGLLKEIEKGTRELADKNEVDRTKAVVKLNELGKQLEKRRQEIGGKAKIQQQLSKLKNLERGPADKMAAAMKRGNWKQALDELSKMQEQLKSGDMPKEQQEQLAKQLGQMQQKLAAVAEAHKQAEQDLKRQIEEQRRKGNLAKTNELEQKLNKLAAMMPQMMQMQKMAENMEDAQKALKQGNKQQAAEAMGQMAAELGQMQQEMEELEMLDAMMAELEDAKGAMGCQQCQGGGCEACEGQGMAGMGMDGMGKPGMGMGRGIGLGPRPDEENPTNLRDSRVRAKPGRGAVTFGGFAEGGNIRGNVLEDIKEEMSGSTFQPADPLIGERLPKSHREHAEEYFRGLRE